MSKNIINDLDKYTDSESVEHFKNKSSRNPNKKHIKTEKRSKKQNKDLDFM